MRQAQAEAEARGADLLVLPEGALALGQGLPAPGAVEVLSGGFRQEEIELRSSVLRFPPEQLEANGAIDKHRLVPLGEWVPGGSLLRWAGLSAVGGVEPGQRCPQMGRVREFLYDRRPNTPCSGPARDMP